MPITSKHVQTSSLPAPFLPNGSVDVRMIAAVRCILAFSALVIAYADPTQPAIFSALTYTSLVIYAIWSFVLAIMAFRRDLSAPPPRDTHWGDVLFCAYLVTLTQGTNSLFFTFFLFAILSASFSRGFQEGLLVTGASVILFILASIWFEPNAKLGFDQSLVRPIYLLTLGYMISYWGGHEITQRRRMRILQEVNNQSNPRFGNDHAIRVNLDRIVNFFEAKAAILVLKRPTVPPTYLSYYTSRRAHGEGVLESPLPSATFNPDSSNPDSISKEATQILLNLPSTFSACYENNPPWWKRYLPGAYPAIDPYLTKQCRALADLLNTPCFLTVPYTQHDGSAGHVFLIPQKHGFNQADVEFVAQLVMSISRIVESMQLMDELVSESAKHERFRISLDIHDTTIQPYIGLKLGLDALNRQAGLNNPLSKEISELLSMTEATIRDLRRYATTLRDDKELAGDSLITSIQDQANHFKRFYGINVKVLCDAEIKLNSRLAGAVLQLFAEGLSNLLRHTQTRNAYLSMRRDGPNLLLEIANESTEGAEKSKSDFIPRSINARAISLGGSSLVQHNADDYTVVQISIPL